ncbi:hypothetical protein M758_1G232500 [Ceratodon purpureus]|nr:hypothetical protein M758_1G232500 [Ceratodon purpureus]
MGRTQYSTTIKNETKSRIEFKEDQGSSLVLAATIDSGKSYVWNVDSDSTYSELWVGPVNIDRDDVVEFSSIAIRTKQGSSEAFEKVGTQRREDDQGIFSKLHPLIPRFLRRSNIKKDGDGTGTSNAADKKSGGQEV